MGFSFQGGERPGLSELAPPCDQSWVLWKKSLEFENLNPMEADILISLGSQHNPLPTDEQALGQMESLIDLEIQENEKEN